MKKILITLIVLLLVLVFLKKYPIERYGGMSFIDYYKVKVSEWEKAEKPPFIPKSSIKDLLKLPDYSNEEHNTLGNKKSGSIYTPTNFKSKDGFQAKYKNYSISFKSKKTDKALEYLVPKDAKKTYVRIGTFGPYEKAFVKMKHGKKYTYKTYVKLDDRLYTVAASGKKKNKTKNLMGFSLYGLKPAKKY